MKSNSAKQVFLVFISLSFLFFNSCNKNGSEIDTQGKDQYLRNFQVLNFSFATETKGQRKSVKEIPLSHYSSLRKMENNSVEERRGGCGAFFTDTRSVSGYYAYQQDTLDLSATVEGSTITLSVSAYDVPNRFAVYSNTGLLMAISPWMGYANYGGPWGLSLNTNPNGTLTFIKSSSSQYYLRVETCITTTADTYQVTMSCTVPSSISRIYAGVTVRYYSSTGLLQFNSVADFSNVIDSLNTQYETYNNNYEDQYPTLTPDQLDIVDSVNNFDEFYTFRQFEVLFPGYVSKRSQIEDVENTWLANNFAGIDPDNIDQTFDEGENTVANSNYKVVIGTTTYSLDASGTISSSLPGGGAQPLPSGCVTNKHKKLSFYNNDNSRRFDCKTAIRASLVGRSSVLAKVISFKKKKKGYKRARMKLLITGHSTILNNGCEPIFASPWDRSKGYKNRKSLRVYTYSILQLWKAQYDEQYASFVAQNQSSGTVYLQ